MSSPGPQAAPFVEQELQEFLKRPLIAKLATHNEDGTIHIAPIWFRYADGDLLFATPDITRKARNVRRNPDVSVLIDTLEPDAQGVLIYGRACLDYDDVKAKGTFVFEQYMSHERAEALAERLAAASWQSAIIRVTPLRMASFDYTKGW